MSSRATRYLGFAFAAALVLAADQASKAAAIAVLAPNQSQDFLGSVVRLYLTYNNSAAFSIGFGQTYLFTLLSAAAAVALIWFSRRLGTIGWAVLGGVALGGVLGNLTDRLFRAPGFPNGQVVDFIQIPFNFPIFNLADSAICVVACIVIIQIARGKKLGG